jgi:hypothetical protein
MRCAHETFVNVTTAMVLSNSVLGQRHMLIWPDRVPRPAGASGKIEHVVSGRSAFFQVSGRS